MTLQGWFGFQPSPALGPPIIDTIASLIGHGLCSRFRVEVHAGGERVELGPSLLHDMEYAYQYSPMPSTRTGGCLQPEHLRAPFHEEDPRGSSTSSARTACSRVGLPHPRHGDPSLRGRLADCRGLHQEGHGRNLNRLMGFDTPLTERLRAAGSCNDGLSGVPFTSQARLCRTEAPA